MEEITPLVSIIVPVYNRPDLLGEMVVSILNQSYSHWELLLVDDGSTEETHHYLKNLCAGDSRIFFFERTKDRKPGGNAARNIGFERSRGSFINWFDSDDKMHPFFIERKVEAFLRNPGYDIVFSKTIETNFLDIYSKNKRLNKTDNLLRDYIIRKVSWFLPDGMFNREYLEGKELFDEDLKGGQDRDFYIKLLAYKEPSVKILNFYGTYYRLHPNSISEKLYRNVSYEVQLSHYQSLIKQVQLLKENKKLDDYMQYHYFREIKKRLPAIMKVKSSNSNLYNYFYSLYDLSGFKRKYWEAWLQIVISCFGFLMVGKGERFLK